MQKYKYISNKESFIKKKTLIHKNAKIAVEISYVIYCTILLY